MVCNSSQAVRATFFITAKISPKALLTIWQGREGAEKSIMTYSFAAPVSATVLLERNMVGDRGSLDFLLVFSLD